MDDPVLIISTEIDLATDAVVLELHRLGVPLVRWNTDRYPYELGASAGVQTEASGFSVGGAPLHARSVWYRRMRSAVAPEAVDAGVHEYCLREAHALIQGIAMTAAPARTMSDPAAIMRAENKVVQLHRAQAVGLEVPETCVTNDPKKARLFLQRHTEAIAKPLRSGWFEDADGEWAIYTNRVTEEMRDRLDRVAMTPCIFQPLIEKTCDVRVTIVGRDLVAIEIDSQRDESSRVDWRRTTNPNLAHRRVELPAAVANALIALMTDLRLHFGAIDLIRTRDDRYVFLEVNPNGQWLWLDDRTDSMITQKVAAWLALE